MRQMLAFAAALIVLATTAHAQFRGFGRGYDRPEIDSRELERIAERLSLSPEQVDLAGQIHAAYVAEATELGQRMRETMDGARDEFRQTRDTSVWRDLREIMVDFESRRDRLTRTFLDDLQLTLGVDDESWAGVERQHRRLRDLPENAVLSGESVDLVEIARDLEIDDREGVARVLSSYEMELDRAIRERDEAQAPIRADPFAYFGPDATEDAQAALEEAREKSAAIRDLHRRFARQIRPALDDPVGAAFDEEILERSFPRVYTETPADRALATVEEMGTLTGEQREAVASLAERYRRDVAAANERLADAIESDEMTRVPGPPRRGRDGGETSEELSRLNEEKRRLVADAVSSLRSILTEEQAASLPEAEDAGDWRGRARRSFGGG